MSRPLGSRKALVLSPSATHPRDYGNRNRVFQTTSFLKEQGFEIHFLLYPFESDWVSEIPPSALEMRRSWDSFTVLPPSRPLHSRAAGSHHEIDEWWDPQIGSYLEWLLAREWFDVFLVNYTFFSKAFEYAPESTVKVLETHDMFAGRKELFAAHGADAEFFYTTAEQERIALDRANIVIAIKDGEAELMRATGTTAEVISIPFYAKARSVEARPGRLDSREELRVGFIGALNSVNRVNMQRFLDRLEKYRTLYVPPTISIHVAGDVCSQLTSPSADIKLLGRVETVEEFYEDVDVVVAPMAFSTGIKIKVAEALSHGKPVVATRNGFDGFPEVDPFHALENIDAVCRALIKLAFDRHRLQLLEMRSSIAAQLAGQRSADGYNALRRAIARRAKRIVFITDEAIWNVETVRQARIAQWCELCSYAARTALIYVGTENPRKFSRSASRLAKFVDIYSKENSPGEILRTVDRLLEFHTIQEFVVSVRGESGQRIGEALQSRAPHVTFDMWVPELAEMAIRRSGGPVYDIWLSGEDSEEGQCLPTTALRYLPQGFDSWRKRRSKSGILVALCDPDSFDRAGVQTLLASAALASSLTVIEFSLEQEIEAEKAIFARLKQLDIPRIVVAIGQNLRLQELSRCLATGWGVECISVSVFAFPCILGGALSGLCRSYVDLAEFLVGFADRSESASCHSGDVGWSTYWRLVTQRTFSYTMPISGHGGFASPSTARLAR
ncbi:MAG TPA: glycosyltransferase [Rhizomicrobium sp.]|jgi:glycosyltransferase involved in cell wall biosynthesis